MHHAYIIVGSPAAAQKYLVETWQIEVLPQVVTSFGIDHSRELKADQSRKTADGERRHLVFVCDTITVEAQQALLKTFEEPTPGVHLFLVVPERHAILPTLLSRVQLVELKESVVNSGGKLLEAKQFLNKTPEERLSAIAKFLEAYEEPARLRRASQEFVRQLAGELRLKKAWSRLAELERALNELQLRAAMPRLVLEHLAMLI